MFPKEKSEKFNNSHIMNNAVNMDNVGVSQSTVATKMKHKRCHHLASSFHSEKKQLLSTNAIFYQQHPNDKSSIIPTLHEKQEETFNTKNEHMIR